MKPLRLSLVSIIIASAALLFLTQGLPVYNQADGIGYYAYLRSPVIDGDFLFLNEYRAMGMMPEFYDTTPTGLLANPFSTGSAILWLPFFLLAHLILSAAAMGTGMSPSGFGGFYYLAISLATATYAAAGLILVAKAWTFLEPSEDKYSPSAVAAAGLGTPLIYYTLRDPIMPHGLSFFSLALALVLWFSARRDGGWQRWFATGWVIGLAATIRTQNVLFLIWPMGDLLIGSQKDRAEKLKFLPPVLGGAAVAFLPQLIVWKVLNGGWFSTSEGVVSLELTDPKIMEILFSSFHGLFLWSPVMLLGLVGLVMALGRGKIPALLVGSFALQVMINSFVKVWWGGVSFGHRQFLNSLPALAIGMAILARGKIGRILLMIGTGWGLFLYLGLGRGQIYLGNPLTTGEMLSISYKNLLAGVLSLQFWIPAGILPPAMWLNGVFMTAVVISVFILFLRSTFLRARPIVFGMIIVTAITFLWAGAGVKTLKTAPQWRPEITEATAGSPGLERFIDSTSKTYEGLYLLKKNDLKRAEADFRQAAAARPEYRYPFELLAVVFHQTGRDKLAAACLKIAASIPGREKPPVQDSVAFRESDPANRKNPFPPRFLVV